MDKKKSFLDVLVQAVHEKFPHLLSASSELTKVPEAENGMISSAVLFSLLQY